MAEHDHVDLSNLPPGTYVAFAQVGTCKRCGRTEDLRMGACWDCCDHIKGRLLRPGVHELWDGDNPENKWIVDERGQ